MLLITKLSLVIAFTMVVIAIASIFDLVNRQYANYIMYIGIAIQIILLIIMIVFIIIRWKTLDIIKKGVKIVRYRFEDKLIKGDTDILPEHMTTTNPRKLSIFKIYLEINDFDKEHLPDFGICKTGTGKIKGIEDIKKEFLNINAGVMEGGVFVFHADLVVKPSETINFKFAKDTIIKKFFLGEIYIP